MKKRIIFIFSTIFISILFLNTHSAFAGSVTLAWDPPDGETPDLAGYKIYYGNSSGNYTYNIDVGNVTTYTITDLQEGLTYYFAATAYDTSGNESEYSNEINITIPFTQYTITVNKAGTGSGIVNSSPEGINCGLDCTESYNEGSIVTLTATADTGSVFEGFSGDGCSGTGSCTFTISSNKTITATFKLMTYTITASATPGGSISPSGNINVNHGESITFTIIPNAGYHILDVIVDGISAGPVSTYTFGNITSNHTINASFAKNTYILSVTKKGNGTITSNPAGINCGADCSETFEIGTVVTLAANPSEGSVFEGWSGSCSGTGVCSLTIDGAKNVEATFTLKTYTITATAGKGGSISPSGNVTVNYGSDQVFTILPSSGYRILDVKIDGISQGSINTYTFEDVKENHTIEAIFKDRVPPSAPLRLRLKR